MVLDDLIGDDTTAMVLAADQEDGETLYQRKRHLLFTGLGLKTRELIKALANYRFNAFAQLFNLGVLPVGICACGNLLGVFVTPGWVVALLGKSSSVDFVAVLLKLSGRCALLGVCMGLAWFALGVAGFPPALRVMGLFGCTHKTVAMGVPLIDAIYGDDSNKGLYLLPLLVWHPTQLIVGSFLANPLSKWIAKHRASAEVVAGEAPDDAAIEAPPPDSPLVSRKAAS
ncbi:symporter [Aureococcus anophagefferens]|uniref:Symporter n=1 Tax=Aureococcus anophagefferens TaxID=44056 RepID=A0ABR1FZ54_AURAN